ncbi:MAG TPA: hypothetical protein VG028_01060 [Terriglobia bacterium]|nr:hypothetical protein [Terriglobia bacterium]
MENFRHWAGLILIIFAGLGLIGFRFCLASPLGTKPGILPMSWQRWFFGEPHEKK